MSEVSTTGLRELVSEALASESLHTERSSGASDYDVLAERIKEIATGDHADSAAEILLAIAETGRDEPASWWSSLLSLFEEFKHLSLRTKLAIVESYARHPPKESLARALFLSVLAHLGCRIDWDKLPAGSRAEDLEGEFPLFIADALVWAKELKRATLVLARARKLQKIDDEDLAAAEVQWRAILPDKDVDALMGFGSATHRTKPIGDIFTNFADKLDRFPSGHTRVA